ncbi:hypothetical protein LFM09_13550 [Lentzea alba]|uniref:hypothetical protein n=1 Tax=Lentzea alba TaxID=2714351 RepID=UPI0039BF8530
MDVADIISIFLGAISVGAATNVLYAVSALRRRQKSSETKEDVESVEDSEKKVASDDEGHDVVMRVTSEGKTFDVYSAAVALRMLEEIGRSRGRVEVAKPGEDENHPGPA